VGRSQGDLAKIADLVDSFLDTPQMEACIARFRALPGGAEMMAEHYPPLQPDLERSRLTGAAQKETPSRCCQKQSTANVSDRT
jgi:hypothetical protein